MQFTLPIDLVITTAPSSTAPAAAGQEGQGNNTSSGFRALFHMGSETEDAGPPTSGTKVKPDVIGLTTTFSNAGVPGALLSSSNTLDALPDASLMVAPDAVAVAAPAEKKPTAFPISPMADLVAGTFLQGVPITELADVTVETAKMPEGPMENPQAGPLTEPEKEGVRQLAEAGPEVSRGGFAQRSNEPGKSIEAGISPSPKGQASAEVQLTYPKPGSEGATVATNRPGTLQQTPFAASSGAAVTPKPVALARSEIGLSADETPSEIMVARPDLALPNDIETSRLAAASGVTTSARPASVAGEPDQPGKGLEKVIARNAIESPEPLSNRPTTDTWVATATKAPLLQAFTDAPENPVPVDGPRLSGQRVESRHPFASEQDTPHGFAASREPRPISSMQADPLVKTAQTATAPSTLQRKTAGRPTTALVPTASSNGIATVPAPQISHPPMSQPTVAVPDGKGASVQSLIAPKPGATLTEPRLVSSAVHRAKVDTFDVPPNRTQVNSVGNPPSWPSTTAVRPSAAFTSGTGEAPRPGPAGPETIQQAQPTAQITPVPMNPAPVLPNSMALLAGSMADPNEISDRQGVEIGELPEEMTRHAATETALRDGPRSPGDIRLPRQVAVQLADAARGMPDRPVEISLNPEELGNVKMTLKASEGAISVVLAIERGETADLMRRNLDALTEEFRDLGYRDITFSFTGGDAHHPEGDRRSDDPPGTVNIGSEQEPEAITPIRLTLGGGVDIRL